MYITVKDILEYKYYGINESIIITDKKENFDTIYVYKINKVFNLYNLIYSKGYTNTNYKENVYSVLKNIETKKNNYNLNFTVLESHITMNDLLYSLSEIIKKCHNDKYILLRYDNVINDNSIIYNLHYINKLINY